MVTFVSRAYHYSPYAQSETFFGKNWNINGDSAEEPTLRLEEGTWRDCHSLTFRFDQSPNATNKACTVPCVTSSPFELVFKLLSEPDFWRYLLEVWVISAVVLSRFVLLLLLPFLPHVLEATIKAPSEDKPQGAFPLQHSP